MNIGFYGHSIAIRSMPCNFNYIELFEKQDGFNVAHVGCPQCSEERILFDLKKTKNLDIAVIWHASPSSMFVPSLKRDFSTLDRDDLYKKLNDISAKAVREFVEISDFSDEELELLKQIPNMAAFEIVTEKRPDVPISDHEVRALSDWNNGDNTQFKELIKLYDKNVDFKFYSEVFDTLELYKKYLHDADAQRNRYYGALLQIDQYVSAMNIPTIHCTGKSSWYPNWFNFSSGIVEKELYMIQETPPYKISNAVSENGMSEEGNRIVYDRLSELIKQLRG